MKEGARKHDSAVPLARRMAKMPESPHGLDSQASTCESRLAKSLRALGFVGTRHFWGYFLYAFGKTKKAIAAYWQPTATSVSTWKSSWYPNTCG